jgi:hypothetical protein
LTLADRSQGSLTLIFENPLLLLGDRAVFESGIRSGRKIYYIILCYVSYPLSIWDLRAVYIATQITVVVAL